MGGLRDAAGVVGPQWEWSNEDRSPRRPPQGMAGGEEPQWDE